jgi:hypothetical protein
MSQIVQSLEEVVKNITDQSGPSAQKNMAS